MSFTPITPYTIPAWTDGAAPAITAQRLIDIGNAVRSGQIGAQEAQQAVTTLAGRVAAAEANITTIFGYGLSVVNGALNITFEEG